MITDELSLRRLTERELACAPKNRMQRRLSTRPEARETRDEVDKNAMFSSAAIKNACAIRDPVCIYTYASEGSAMKIESKNNWEYNKILTTCASSMTH